MNQPRVPVLSHEGVPHTPCRPSRAKQMLKSGRATKRWINGNFAVQLTERLRKDPVVKPMVLGIKPGSRSTGFALTTEDEAGNREAHHLMELEHVGFQLSQKLQRRAAYRKARRSRLRYRQPRSQNRTKPDGWLPPSLCHDRDQTLKWATNLCRLYPVKQIRIGVDRFDIQLLDNPDIRGLEYQRGTLFGWQLRAYVFHRDGHRCAYCDTHDQRLELDHVIPKANGGTDRVRNLVASCRDCNRAKDDTPVEEFLAQDTERLLQVIDPKPRKYYRDATRMNVLTPALLEGLTTLNLPIERIDGATTSWNRNRLDLPRSKASDAVILGTFTGMISLPDQVRHVKPENGRRKQKAHIDRHGTPVGRPFRTFCRLDPRSRSKNPTPGHAGKRTRLGSDLIGTGDLVTIKHHQEGRISGRGVVRASAGRVAIKRDGNTLTATVARTKLVRHHSRYSSSSQLQPATAGQI